MKAHAICDGRGNAGTGARAAILFCPDGSEIERAEKIPPTTNIVAEHLSIQLALELALENGITDLVIFNDSQVPVFQVQGLYAVRQPHLIPHVQRTWELGALFDSVSVEWKPRSETLRADKLCRKIDVLSKPYRRKSPRLQRTAIPGD